MIDSPPADLALSWEISPALHGRLVFVRCGDRYAHHLELIRDGRATRVLSSVEGQGDPPWPASPPLQQLSFHQTPAGQPCALLVGMAGQSHWSLSVERHAEGCLIFDAACRVQQPPAWLGSSYRLAAGADRAADGSWLLPGEERLRLAVRVCGPDAASVAAQSEGFAICPPLLPQTLPATFRWRYRLDLTANGTSFSGLAP